MSWSCELCVKWCDLSSPEWAASPSESSSTLIVSCLVTSRGSACEGAFVLVVRVSSWEVLLTEGLAGLGILSSSASKANLL